MKDYTFAEKLYQLRKSEGISQKELSKSLDVTNKAISKWETGEAFPSVSQLIKLSEIFDVSIDEMLKSPKICNKKITKICITGGPCSGKTTALSWIQTEFRKKGYHVLFVPETATELILGGIAPWTIESCLEFETYILKLQIEKEKLFEEAAKHIDNNDKILIVCDRGTMDCKAYMTESEFNRAIKNISSTEVKLRDNYDAVFHLVTAAKGAKDFYTHDNNNARYESIDEAIIADEKTMNAWTGHPHLRVIDNSTNFEQKMRRLMAEISLFLGEPAPYEVERKYLIEYPNISNLDKLENCHKVEIVQTYLKSDINTEVRVRQRGENGNFTYTKTIKQCTSDPAKRIETETRITKDEYIRLLLQSDTTKHQIRKTRYCLVYQGQYFEIDIYPSWKDKAIMEIELLEENQKINFPKFIKVIKEVTGDPSYFNTELAKTQM